MFPISPLPAVSSTLPDSSVVLVSSSVDEVNTITPPIADPSLEWVGTLSDEFNGESLDRSKWVNRFVGWDGEGRQDANGDRLFRFDPNQVAVAEGQLSLSAQHSDPAAGQRFQTGSIYSQQSIQYGYIEIRARSADSGISSNFWLTNNNQPDYGGEIDVFELAGGPEWNDILHTTLHAWHTPIARPPWADHLVAEADQYPFRVADAFAGTGQNPDLTAEYHTYGLHWTAEQITIYLDGQVVSQQPNTHWHQPMHLVIDREAYENWFPLPNSDQALDTFDVDYVRVWQTPEQAAVTAPAGISGSLFALPHRPGWQVKDTADFDRDGQPDLLVYNAEAQQTQLWLLDGPAGGYGLKEVIDIATEAGQVPLGAGDFDGDGDPDIVMQQQLDNGWIGAVVHLFDGIQRLGARLSLNNNASWDYGPRAIGDFNQDGLADILTEWDSELPANQRRYQKLWLNGGLSVDPSNGQERYVVDLGIDLPAWVGWQPIATGDFNQNGRSEIIIRNPAENWNGEVIDRTVILFLEDQAGLYGDFETRVQGTAPLDIPTGWEVIGAANFNPAQDDFVDVLVQNPETGETGAIFLTQVINPYDPLNLAVF